LKIEITYKGILLEVEGTYTKAEEQPHDYPGYPASFDVNAIFVQDVDIYELLSEDSLIEIETLVLEEICGV
jgi:hypothetical protein